MRNKFPTRLSFLFFGLKSVTMSAHIPFMHNLTGYFLSDHDHSEAWLVVTHAPGTQTINQGCFPINSFATTRGTYQGNK